MTAVDHELPALGSFHLVFVSDLQWLALRFGGGSKAGGEQFLSRLGHQSLDVPRGKVRWIQQNWGGRSLRLTSEF